MSLRNVPAASDAIPNDSVAPDSACWPCRRASTLLECVSHLRPLAGCTCFVLSAKSNGLQWTWLWRNVWPPILRRCLPNWNRRAPKRTWLSVWRLLRWRPPSGLRVRPPNPITITQRGERGPTRTTGLKAAQSWNGMVWRKRRRRLTCMPRQTPAVARAAVSMLAVGSASKRKPPAL